MIVQSSLETRQQLWHKQHFVFSPCLTPSCFFQQACISPSANLSYFQFLSLALTSIPFLITLSLCQIFYSCLPFLLISSPAVIWRFQPGGSTLLCHSYRSPLSTHFLSHRFPVSTSIAVQYSCLQLCFLPPPFFHLCCSCPFPASILLSILDRKFVFLNRNKM